jgi:hypothetical protein
VTFYLVESGTALIGSDGRLVWVPGGCCTFPNLGVMVWYSSSTVDRMCTNPEVHHGISWA